MNTQDIVQQLIDSATSNPDLFSNIAEHPYSTIRDTTGLEEVSQDQVSEALTAFSALAGGEQIDFGNLASLAAQLLADNNGSAHALASSLFGAQAQTPPQTDMLSNLANVVFGNGIAGVDLSDGFGLDDAMGIANALFGDK